MAVKYEAEPPVFSFKLVFIKAFLEARHFSMHHGGRKRNEALSFPSGDLKNHAHKQNCSSTEWPPPGSANQVPRLPGEAATVVPLRSQQDKRLRGLGDC